MIRKRTILCLFIFFISTCAMPALIPAEPARAESGVSSAGDAASPQAAAGPIVGGCDVFPPGDIWNMPVDTLPVAANSSAYVATIGASANVHADFGSGTWDGGPIGIPFTTVPGTQPKVKIVFDYDDESDPGPYPIPPNAPIEGGKNGDGDRHVLVVDRDACKLYELYLAYPQPDNSWEAGSGAVYDLKSHHLRPAGWTSADAAGLPILPGLVRYSEVASGQIKHAIRFTAPQTRKAYVWPARHYASDLTGSQYPPMGQRFRLKAGFDISGFSPDVQVILKALKKYGMILADNGSSWYLSGAPDSRWDNDVLHELHSVPGSSFEAVDCSSLKVSSNSGLSKPIVRVTAPDSSASETGPDTGRFQVSRIGDVSGPLTVNYSVSGTAKPVTDYGKLSGSVTILAGKASASVYVRPKADTTAEPAETVILTLSPNTAYVIGSPKKATVTIQKDQ